MLPSQSRRHSEHDAYRQNSRACKGVRAFSAHSYSPNHTRAQPTPHTIPHIRSEKIDGIFAHRKEVMVWPDVK